MTTCPGCGETFGWQLESLQEVLDGDPAVVNGGGVRVTTAAQVVDAVLAEHVATCGPVQGWLLRVQRRDWRKVVRACGLPSTRKWLAQQARARDERERS